MKTLKHGEQWWHNKQFICNGCGGRFEIEPGDPVSVGSMKNTFEPAVTVVCPDCFKDCVLSKTSLTAVTKGKIA